MTQEGQIVPKNEFSPSTSPEPGDRGARETSTVREGIALYNLPTCYRQVHNRMDLCVPLFMNISMFEFEARSSLRKCPTRTKNQERIFIPGDIVSIIMNFDPFKHVGDVWFIVKKRKTGVMKLWKRNWGAIKGYLESCPSITTMRLRVREVGYVYEDKRVHTASSLECPGGGPGFPLECVAVCFNGLIPSDKKNSLWVEVGLFNIVDAQGREVYVNDYVIPRPPVQDFYPKLY